MIKKEIDYRFERKFLFSSFEISSIKNIEYSIPYGLKKSFNPRRVNSIYYDTFNYKLASESLNGNSQRYKVRVRYYGNYDDIQKPILEIKYKNGLLGYKYKLKLDKKEFVRNNYSLFYLLNKENLPFENQNLLFELEPSLFVSYSREYYESKINSSRFTFDNLIFFKYLYKNDIFSSIKNNAAYEINQNILEFKYPSENDDFASLFTKNMPFRLSTCSKYLIGLNTLSLI